MSVTLALAGNPNSGKTTLFNSLTGLNQFVGNWPGVTVEKKEGALKDNKDVAIMDLPGVYSLSPYSLEEVVARNYLLDGRPDAILNIVDGTNIERNLYLTTQLLELGIPVVAAVNMIDLVDKKGDVLDVEKLSHQLGCDVVRVSALKGTGVREAAEKALEAARRAIAPSPAFAFSNGAERALSSVADLMRPKLGQEIPEARRRFFAVKLFEGDEKIAERVAVSDAAALAAVREKAERDFDDDAESVITNERYTCIAAIVRDCFHQKSDSKVSASDKIDRVVTNKWLAFPLFALVMFLIYYVSVTTVGAWSTDWANDGLFGGGWRFFGIGTADYQVAVEASTSGAPDPADFGLWIPGIPSLVSDGLRWAGVSGWLRGLIVDGIVGGLGAVLGFVPQMFVLFVFLAILEDCGYMARIAFIMDRIFRKFGLSGKSFIPILIGTGCGVPGLMASRAIENDRDRKMTLITTTFIPCGAKLPVIALIAGAIFAGEWWVAPSAYFAGIAAIISSGVLLKKTWLFSGEPAPFVMELPAYHLPTASGVLRSAVQRSWAFVKKAGTIILLSVVAVWFLSSFGFEDGKLTQVEDLGDGILAHIGRSIAWIFEPLGFGDWKAAVATITGLVAKENVVGTFGILYGFAEVAEDGAEIWGPLATSFTPLAAYSLLIFNLLCAPCFAAVGAIRREMNNWKWTLFAVGYQTSFAYFAALCVYQYGTLLTTGTFGTGAAVALALTVVFAFLLFRPQTGAFRSIRTAV
ncbi:MAG: ferrous iron transporter B [Synergistaceae bacterium]|jgi:ferrous iron transport protein B|nr:ferrous iron transporter B [Synergistaceae bacterium]